MITMHMSMNIATNVAVSVAAVPVWLTPRPNAGFWAGVVVAILAWLWLRRRLRRK